MFQPYNHIGFSLSSTNHMKIKVVNRNRTIIKCFCFYKKHIFYFTTIFCGTTLFINTLNLSVCSIIQADDRTCTFTKF